MTAAGGPGGHAAEGGMLASAVGYALVTTGAVGRGELSLPTPCRGWDLRMLLRHAAESLAALREGLGTGRVSLCPAADDARDDPVGAFRERARLLLHAWAAAGPSRAVAIADRCLPADLMAAAGALEIAVHGWDVSRACGQRRPIPPVLATGLLAVAPLLVPADDRAPLFAPAIPVAPTAAPSDRLTAFLGRAPRP